MDKYGAINIHASLKEDEIIILNDSGMEKQSNVSDSSNEPESRKNKCPQQYDISTTKQAVDCRE
jgi:hypothetical protein